MASYTSYKPCIFLVPGNSFLEGSVDIFMPKPILPLHSKGNLLLKLIEHICTGTQAQRTTVAIATLVNWALASFFKGKKKVNPNMKDCFHRN